jgi:RNA polymerase sigma-70 factor (ECF subfamily)
VSLEAETAEHGKSLADTLRSNAAEPGEEAEAAERQRAVRDAVDGLPAELREAVVLCEWEEMSAADVANILNTSKRGVESRLYRARQKLRQELAKWLM